MAYNIQTEIETLKGHIVYLGTVVEENMLCAIKALVEKDPDLAHQVMQTDRCEIDYIETDVEQECLRIMVLHQPVASDLRFLVTVLKINSDLERIGDLVAKVADKVLLLYPSANRDEHIFTEPFRFNVERVMILAGGGPEVIITADMLPQDVGSMVPAMPTSNNGEHIMGLPLREAREVFERDYLIAQISRFSGNISRTAEFVGMERSALHRKLKALGVG